MSVKAKSSLDEREQDTPISEVTLKASKSYQEPPSQHVDPPGKRVWRRILNHINTPPNYYGEPGQGNSRWIAVVSTLFFIALWTLVTEAGWVAPLFLPSPLAVVHKFVELWVDGFAGVSLGDHLIASLSRVFGAFILAVITAVPIGILVGTNVWMRGIFDPLIEFYRPLPPLAYLPLVIIWLGIDETSKVTLIYLAMFAPIALSARAGVTSARSEQIQAAYSMGASKLQVLYHVIIKSAMPEILTGLRIGIGFGWTTLVASEMVAAQAGIGYMVLNAAEFLVTDVVIAGIIIIGVIAYTFDLFMRYLEKWLVPWKGY
ncbi:taurine transport system permease protein [Vibrio xiamenensis]|uniref:Taurine transport system permease protein n=1 Tax=Vibrio xiamenensis TaxID=861298 RepID=A0A1G8A2A8_9VIBR|nr:ABC transporter permease subunit [Vibrio xiamenensis]SDH14993.1 taurine transport system permease protein [Vibrio xiamenensis]